MIRTVFRTYRAAFSGLPREVWLLSAVMVVNRSGSMVLPFISLYLTQEQGMSVSAAGRILGLYGIGSAIGSFTGGWLSDRIGSRRTVLLSLGISGIGFIWLGYQRTIWAISLALFLLSIVAEAFRPAVMVAMGEAAPARLRMRSYALLRLAANLGMGIGPAVGGVLALNNYLWLFLADAVTCWCAALMLLRQRPRAPVEETEADSPRSRSGSPWSDGPFLLLMGLVLLLATCFFQIMSTLPVYFREVYQFREDRIGGLLALNAGLIVLLEMVLIHWVERWDRMVVVGVGCLLVCVGFGLMPLGSAPLFVALTIVVWTFGEMLALPLLNAVVADRAGRANRGGYMGLYTLTYSLAFILAPAAGTQVYDRLGAEALWYGIGGLGLPLLGACLALRRTFPYPVSPREDRRPKELGSGGSGTL